MSSAFPLVRAADIAPFIRWMQNNGRPIDGMLSHTGLPMLPWEVPDRPISLLGALSITRSLATEEGPDIPTRVVSEGSILDLGDLGAVMLGGQTPRKALARVCAAMPRHSTHELMTLVPVTGGLIVREQLTLDVDDITRHLVQQYVAALIRALCRMTGYRGEPLGRIELTPHPEFGLAHLGRGLGPVPLASDSQTLSVFVPDDVLDCPFPTRIRALGSDKPRDEWAVLRGERGEKTYRNTARVFIESLLENGEATIERFAEASGASLRTVQRRLAEEGTSFSVLLDEVRRECALRDIRVSSRPIASVAAELGYSGQPAFVRAVRRWTGVSPREYRKKGA